MALTNQSALPQTIASCSQVAESDLVTGVYEGGLKVWECSFDLVDYVYANPSLVQGKRVLELGCGQGLPGIACLINGAAHVCFHDYNQEVIQNATKPVCELNQVFSEEKCSLHSGSWQDFITPETAG